MMTNSIAPSSLLTITKKNQDGITSYPLLIKLVISAGKNNPLWRIVHPLVITFTLELIKIKPM